MKKSVASTRSQKGRIGSSFEQFLEEQGTLSDATGLAVKRVLAYQLEEAMKRQAITKTDMAARMHTSRTQLERILSPDNDGVTLKALVSAAKALGHELTIELR